LEDPEWHGFERIGSVLTLSPSNIEKYFSAAETVLAEAYPAVKPEFLDVTKRAVTENEVDENHRERLRELGLLDKVRYEVWAGDVFRGSINTNLPEAGIYEITYKLSGLKRPTAARPDCSCTRRSSTACCMSKMYRAGRRADDSHLPSPSAKGGRRSS